MERKIREEKGITLVALIITIIVLLILAVVAISAVTGDGIIQHASNAKTSYENAQSKENSMIGKYEAYLDAHNPNKKIISFTCSLYFYDRGSYKYIYATHQLKAEEGMSWYEWCNSKYNTVNYTCSDEDSAIYLGNGFGERINDNGIPLLGKEIIEVDTVYYMNNEE